MQATTESLSQTLRQRYLQMVAIGGSAGSIDCLLRLCPALPASPGFAVVVAVHLPPDGDGLLPQLLGTRCRMPVLEAQPWMEATPAAVYIAPADYHLAVEADRSFSLSGDEPVNYARPSIDVLFASVADVYGSRALGILLSGANSDGARGLQQIAAAGGMTIVQDPGSAHRPEMPAAALALFEPTAVLPLDDLAEVLRGLNHHDD